MTDTELTSAQIADKARANFPAHINLTYIDYRDQFSAEQIDVLLSGQNEWEHPAFEQLQEWESEERWRSAQEYVKNALDDEDEWDALDPEDFEQLREELDARDESNWYRDLLHGTPNMLFRYDLGVTVDTDYSSPEEDLSAMTDTMIGVFDTDAMDEAARGDLWDKLRAMLPEASYGGQLNIIWYGDPASVVDAVSAARNGKRVTMTFTSYHLLIHDGWNGSGYDDSFDVPLTVTLDPDELTTDTGGRGYSWTSIAGPYEPAYAATPTFTITDSTED